MPVDPPTVNGVVEIIMMDVLQPPSVDVPIVNGDLPNNVVRGAASTPIVRYGSREDEYGMTEGGPPQDFLDVVGTIVHNADVLSHEDLDRLYKAQAMFTVAQVSIQEFDPQLNVECEQMTVRERKRRENLKKEKEKGREKENQKDEKDESQNLDGLGARRIMDCSRS